MPSGTTFGLFCVAALALIVVPGPAVTYVVTQSVDKGRRAGLVSVLGIACGGLVHVAAALADRIRASRRARRIKRYLTGGIFVALGVTAATARRA